MSHLVGLLNWFLIQMAWVGLEILHFLQVPRCAMAGLGSDFGNPCSRPVYKLHSRLSVLLPKVFP